MPDRRRVPRSTLPDQRTLLSWLFVGRLVLAIGILLGAGLVWTERPQESFLVTVAVSPYDPTRGLIVFRAK